MNNQIGQLIAGIATILVGAVIAAITSIFAYYIARKYLPIIRDKTAKWLETNRPKIKDQVKAWLHENNLQESKLLDIYLAVDTVAGILSKDSL